MILMTKNNARASARCGAPSGPRAGAPRAGRGLALLLVLALSLAALAGCAKRGAIERPDWVRQYETHMEGVRVLPLDASAQPYAALDEDSVPGQILAVLGLKNPAAKEGGSLDYAGEMPYTADVLIFCGGQETEAELRKAVEAELREHARFWEGVPAVREGRLVFLPASFSAEGAEQSEENWEYVAERVHELAHHH